MHDIPRNVRKQLRVIADRAWDFELSELLKVLDERFAEWREGRISSHELNRLIHEHHDGGSRDLFKFYTGQKLPNPAIRAIALGLVPKEDVSEEVLVALGDRVRSFKVVNRASNPDSEFGSAE